MYFQECPQFDTLTSSIEEELRAILSDIDSNSDPEWPDLSDPDLESAIIDLIGPLKEKISTPFQLTDKIKRELIRRAEQTGGRALDWSMNTFNKVGGKGTLRSIWNRLKSCHLVSGRKRRCGSQGLNGREKKRKECLNVSATCTRIIELLLDSLPEDERRASRSSERREEVDINTSDSLSDLTSSSLSSGSDSGMSTTIGQVTNLCGDRRPELEVPSGVVTRTDLYMPVTLGFSDNSISSSDWEVVYDLDGNPTGMEILEVGVRRLNFEDENGSSDDGFSGTTRDRIASIQSFSDDVRSRVEFREREHPDPHAVVSIGNNSVLRLNSICAYIMWALLTCACVRVQGTELDQRKNTSVPTVVNRLSYKMSTLDMTAVTGPSDCRTGAFNRHSDVHESGHETTGAFNSDDNTCNSGHGSGVFNIHSNESEVEALTECTVMLSSEHNEKLTDEQVDMDMKEVCNKNDTSESHREWGSSGAIRGGGTPITKLVDTTELGAIVPESHMKIEDVVTDCAGGVALVLDELKSLPTAHIDDSLCEYDAKNEGKPMI